MARVRRCDRCGKYYEPYEHENNTIGMSTFNMDEELVGMEEHKDLCPECMAEFNCWYLNVEYPELTSPKVYGVMAAEE